MEPPVPLTLKEVAARLNVSERTVRRMVVDGEFPQPRYIGPHPRWFSQDVDAYLWQIARGGIGKSGPEAGEEGENPPRAKRPKE